MADTGQPDAPADLPDAEPDALGRAPIRRSGSGSRTATGNLRPEGGIRDTRRTKDFRTCRSPTQGPTDPPDEEQQDAMPSVDAGCGAQPRVTTGAVLGEHFSCARTTVLRVGLRQGVGGGPVTDTP
jgi:hypothetical protein